MLNIQEKRQKKEDLTIGVGFFIKTYDLKRF